MRRGGLFIVSILLPVMVVAYTDTDLDGVDDAVDRCPDSSFDEIVGSDGCALERLSDDGHLTIEAGMNIGPGERAQIVGLDYRRGAVELSIRSSFRYRSDSDDGGINDSSLYLSYSTELAGYWGIRLSGGLIAPAYDPDGGERRIDTALWVTIMYDRDRYIVEGSYGYRWVGDSGMADIRYRDSESLSLSVGYLVRDDLYMGASYGISDSIYGDGVDRIYSIDTLYTLNEKWFAGARWSRVSGDEGDDDYLSLRVGYRY